MFNAVGIPEPRPDLTSLVEAVRAIREQVLILNGDVGNKLDKAATLSDLVNYGLLTAKPTSAWQYPSLVNIHTVSSSNKIDMIVPFSRQIGGSTWVDAAATLGTLNALNITAASAASELTAEAKIVIHFTFSYWHQSPTTGIEPFRLYLYKDGTIASTASVWEDYAEYALVSAEYVKKTRTVFWLEDAQSGPASYTIKLAKLNANTNSIHVQPSVLVASVAKR